MADSSGESNKVYNIYVHETYTPPIRLYSMKQPNQTSRGVALKTCMYIVKVCDKNRRKIEQRSILRRQHNCPESKQKKDMDVAAVKPIETKHKVCNSVHA